MTFDIEIKGLESTIRTLTALEDKLKNPTSLHRHIGNIIQNATEQSFEDQASPFGTPWIKSKKKEGLTLIDSARLASSFSVEANKERMVFGTNLVYAAIHQFGGWAGKGKKTYLPARPFLPVDESGELEEGVKNAIINMVERFLIS